MKSRFSHAVLFSLLALGLNTTLTSCSWFGKKEVAAKVPCPPVAVIADADLYAHFQPGAPWSRETLLYEAKITRVRSACDFAGPKPKKSTPDKDGKPAEETRPLLAALTLAFDVHIAPKHKGRDAKLTYFVAITDRQANILNKSTFEAVAPKPKPEDTKSKTPKRQSVAFTDKPVTLRIPLKKGQTGPDYMIFTGFQISPELLELNRKRRRPPEEFGVKEPEEPKAN
jgi:hypothetical protein